MVRSNAVYIFQGLKVEDVDFWSNLLRSYDPKNACLRTWPWIFTYGMSDRTYHMSDRILA